MSKDLETILDRCLDEIRKGKSIECCLSLYPSFAPDLEPLLRLAKNIEKIPKPEPRKEAINLTLIKVGEAISALERKKRVYQRIFQYPYPFRPVLTKVLAFALILAVMIWSIGLLSAHSLPGTLLYPLKLASERVRFTLTRSAGGRAELRLTFAGSRLEELVRTVERRGRLDEALLRDLLKEAELALDEAKPEEEERFTLFLTKLSYFTDYQQAVLEQLKTRVPAREHPILDKAIEVCRRRCRCMMETKRSGLKKRGWCPGCRWR